MEDMKVKLWGPWRLEFWRIEYEQGRKPGEPFGADPEGLLLYDPSGWMSATMMARRRTPFSAASAIAASLESKASALNEYLAYTGRWWLDGEVIVHDVQCSLNPVLIGTQQRRHAELRGTQLDLTADEEQGKGSSRQQRRHRIRWHKL
jgi:hypothetical protein